MRERPRAEYQGEGRATLLAMAHIGRDYPEAGQWDREYADECDRLSEWKAARRNAGRRRWGRWFEDDGFLSTYIARPCIGEDGFDVSGTYDICLGRLSEDWAAHMKAKTWLGSKGHADLVRALADLREPDINLSSAFHQYLGNTSGSGFRELETCAKVTGHDHQKSGSTSGNDRTPAV